MSIRVLISDALSPRAVEIFRERGIEVEQRVGLKPEELRALIPQFDGLAIRSNTKVTSAILSAATRLRIIGRAGIGVDNVDVAGATARGIVVMNTPFGNSITTAEHAIAMIFALAREIPAANTSTHAGKWEKSRFMGVELTGKTLGIIGCGNIGSIVADRALGLKMKVAASDPFLTPERAQELGVEKLELDALLARADFISLHTPLTSQTRNILDARAFARCRHGVRIINCARGGLVDEAALLEALHSGQVAGAALDVFAEEPARESPLFALENVVCTPHLGASTTEAQENVALQIAEQMSDFLLTGAVSNALNMPSVSAEDAPRLRPYIRLAEQLGSFLGQVTLGGIQSVEIAFEGHVASLNTRPLSSTVLMGLLRPSSDFVNMVNAPVIAKDRGIRTAETRLESESDYHTLIRVHVHTEHGGLALAGTLFSGKPRLIGIDDVALESELTPRMLFVRNKDTPGFIGALGTALGRARINIANFNLGRAKPGADAVCLVSVDDEIPAAVLRQIQELSGVVGVHSLRFEASA
ncbi:MAG TPA: phosphoglycerate dehydrogenase [Burkholderiaceae bacterium]|nr:phosphoglycerate dehydrogenase [Burkholderiaceae bacterium]